MNLLLMILGSPGTSLVVAGGMGGIARWLFVILVDRKMAVPQGVGTVLLGAILGYYVSPNFEGLVAPILSGFSTDPARLPVFAAFSTGVGGVGVVGFIIDWWANRRKKLTQEPSVDPAPKPNGSGP